MKDARETAGVKRANPFNNINGKNVTIILIHKKRDTSTLKNY